MRKEDYYLTRRYQRLVYQKKPQHTYTKDTLIENLLKCHHRLFPNGSLSQSVQDYALAKCRKLPVYKNISTVNGMCYASNTKPRNNQEKNASWKQWARNTSRYEYIQKFIEDNLERIIRAYFQGADDYALEKLTKTFCEPLSILEKHLIEQEYSKVCGPDLIKQHENALTTIKKVMESETRRLARHYMIFLAEVGGRKI